MSHHDYSLEELSDITPYENYITAIRDTVTKKKYAGQLEMFLNPSYDWEKSQQKRKLLPESKFARLVNDFVNLIRKDPNAGKNKIKRYVMTLKKQIDEKKLNPNTSRNRLKPIKTLLRANEVDFSWFLIDRLMPKETKSEDRAYTRAEIQKMIIHCEDITDKVIIIGFSAGGFRLEAWDYFTWSDVVFLKMRMAHTREVHYGCIMEMQRNIGLISHQNFAIYWVSTKYIGKANSLQNRYHLILFWPKKDCHILPG